MIWFKRRIKNRRLGREYVLDVKLRSSQVRAARIRMAALALGAAFATVFSLYLAWRTAEWALRRFVFENSAFAILEIDLQTDGVISTEQLRRWTGIRPGENLMALDLARVKRNLELIPLVQSASVERILPHALRIRVLEREPVAQINVPHPRQGGGVEFTMFQLDEDGCVLLPLDPRQRSASAGQPTEQLPLITGIPPFELQPGRIIEARQIQAALRLVVAFEQSSMADITDLRRVDITSGDVLLATTGQGSEITFSFKDIDQQLRRWREVFEAGQKSGRAIASLDLAVSDSIPARWVDAGTIPPSSPRTPKNLRNKRKHV